MFQFTTTTVINNPVKSTTEDYRKWTKGAYRVVDQMHAYDEEAKDWSDELTDLPDDKKKFVVTDGPDFYADECTEIFVAPFKEEVADKVKITLDGLDETLIYRLVFYIRSVGNADPRFANDFVFKGMPIMVEFTGDAKAKDVKRIAEKHILAVYGEKILTFNATDDTTLEVEGGNGYQRFHYVALEAWMEDDTIEGGAYETVQNYTEDVEIGCEGYGTYAQVLKDLRLPTGDNFTWNSLNASEMPILGGEYTQITVRLCKDLVNFPGGIGVHNPQKSITNHVFFINGDYTEFLSDLETLTGVTSVVVPEEEETEEPGGDTSDDTETVEP